MKHQISTERQGGPEEILTRNNGQMLEWITAVFTAVWDVMLPGTVDVPPLSVALGIAFFAGASTLLGHSAVLYLNRVTGLRATAALVLSGVLLVLLYLAHAMILYLVAPLITGHRPGITIVMAITLASTAPMILGIFEFVPVLGIVFGKLLNAWSFVVLWALTVDAYSTTWLRALIAGGAAWLVMNVLSSLLGPAISRVTARAWRLATGVPTQITARDILAGTPMIPVAAAEPNEGRAS